MDKNLIDTKVRKLYWACLQNYEDDDFNPEELIDIELPDLSEEEKQSHLTKIYARIEDMKERTRLPKGYISSYSKLAEKVRSHKRDS